MGIEPTYPAWKAGVLPLNYTRTKYCVSFEKIGVTGFEPATPWSQTRCSSQTEPHPESRIPVYPLSRITHDAKFIILITLPLVNTFFIFFFSYRKARQI